MARLRTYGRKRKHKAMVKVSQARMSRAIQETINALYRLGYYDQMIADVEAISNGTMETIDLTNLSNEEFLKALSS